MLPGRRVSASVIATAVLVAFAFSGILHSAIPHDHAPRAYAHEHSHQRGHSAPQEESVVWASLHAAVRHEEKYVFLLVAASAILALYITQAVSAVLSVRLPTRALVPIRFESGRWLIRGIAPHRAFS